MRPEDVENEYQRRSADHPQASWGWSFMYTPESALERAKVVLAGLNPGGRLKDQPGEWDYRGGVNAYLDEAWEGYPKGGDPLQQQVAALVNVLHVQPNEVFAANFVPFRSPSWGELPDKEAALAFGRRLLTDLLERTPARLFVTLGKEAGREIAALLGARHVQQHSVDWDPQSMDEFVAPDGRTVLALPHLSRFRIFGGNRTAAATAVGGVAQRVLR
jgi:hypothetical protein